ncbi:MAG: hypothetical protein VCC01_15195 [Candidatus Hydrogenedentota bacterium]
MDLSKIVWVIVILVVVGGAWLLTDGGQDKVYEDATSRLVGNDPDQDVIDEAALSKYGDLNLSMFRHEKAKKFYTAAVERYGTEGKNYWWNWQQLAKCEEKLDNAKGAVDILYNLWLKDGDAFDQRVSSRENLKNRIKNLVELNDLNILNYPMDARRLR